MADEKMKTSDAWYNFKHYANFEICEALEVVSLILKDHLIEDKFSWHIMQDSLSSVWITIILEESRFPVNMCIVLEWVSGA